MLKVGGSLLDWPELAGHLSRDLDGRKAEGGRPVVIVGGGRAADFVRDLDRAHGLGDVRAHRLALRSLDLSAHALAELLPGLDVVDELPALDEVQARGRVPVFAPAPMARRGRRPVPTTRSRRPGT